MKLNKDKRDFKLDSLCRISKLIAQEQNMELTRKCHHGKESTPLEMPGKLYPSLIIYLLLKVNLLKMMFRKRKIFKEEKNIFLYFLLKKKKEIYFCIFP